MIRAYDEYGNIVDIVEWEKKIRAKAIDDMVCNLIRNSRTEFINENICLIVTDKQIKIIAEQLIDRIYRESKESD